MYKNKSGFSAKIKVSIFEQRLVISWKIYALKSRTTHIRAVVLHAKKTQQHNIIICFE